MMKDQFDQRLMAFLHKRIEPFTIDTILEFLETPLNSQNREALSGYLLYNQFAYVNLSDDGRGEYWITRAGLFTGKKLLVRPSAQEVARGILIPGSRLVPFVNPALLPHELSFVSGSRTLHRIPVSMSTASLYSLYRFFGEEYTPQFLALDNEKNRELFSENDYVDPEECTVMAVDMKDVYWKDTFSPGDLIQATVVDWYRGIVNLSVLPASRIHKRRQKEWMRLLEESLVNVFELFGPGASMEEQLSFAFYLDQSLLDDPDAAPLNDFIDWSEKTGIEPYGVESRLWYRDTEIPAQGTWNMAIVSAPANPAEESFMQLGLPVSNYIIDAYILDFLFRRETAVRDLLDRLVPIHDTSPSFTPPAIERFVTQRLSRFGEHYNWFADHEQGMLRNRFVILHNALTVFILHLQNAGIRPNRIPDQGAVVLGQIMAHTISALEILSTTETPDAGEMESLWLSVEGMEESFFETKTSIQEVLPGLMKKRFSVIKEGENPDE